MSDIKGTERQVEDIPLVPIGGGLPYVMELQTGKVLDVLLGVFPTDKTRKQVNDWLYRNSKPGFDTPLGQKADLHIVYGDQRDGHGTAHWWRLYYGDRRLIGKGHGNDLQWR